MNGVLSYLEKDDQFTRSQVDVISSSIATSAIILIACLILAVRQRCGKHDKSKTSAGYEAGSAALRTVIPGDVISLPYCSQKPLPAIHRALRADPASLHRNSPLAIQD